MTDGLTILASVATAYALDESKRPYPLANPQTERKKRRRTPAMNLLKQDGLPQKTLVVVLPQGQVQFSTPVTGDVLTFNNDTHAKVDATSLRFLQSVCERFKGLAQSIQFYCTERVDEWICAEHSLDAVGTFLGAKNFHFVEIYVQQTLERLHPAICDAGKVRSKQLLFSNP